MDKPISVLVGTPHNRDLSPEYVVSLIGLIKKAPYDIGVALYESCLISTGRNVIAQGMNTDYLLFIDSDIDFPYWGLERLVSHDVDIVGGMYYKKGKPHQPVIYNFSNKVDYHAHINNPETKLFEVDGIGTGFLLIKKEVIKKLSDKKFVKKYGFPFNFMQKKDGNEMGEDLAFCHRAKKAGFKIYCDPSIPLKHIGTSEIGQKDYYNHLKEITKIDELPYKNDIPGWMSTEELNWLYKVGGMYDSVIEIGSWKGRSTHALLSAGAKVTAVDHFKGSPGELAHVGEDPYKEFIKNVGHFPNLKVLKMDSTKAAKKVKEKADVVFIDGAHDYESVKRDIETWSPYATKLICGHDFHERWDGVQRAVTEKYGYVNTVGTIWYVKLGE